MLFARTIEKKTQDKFDKFSLQFEEAVRSEKIASAMNDLKMLLNATRPNIPHICIITAGESKISMRIPLRFYRSVRFLVSP